MTHTPTTTTAPTPTNAGVIGVGAMGANHARVYSQLQTVDLVGVSDLDEALADRVAIEYATQSLPTDQLLDRCDVVTVAVPTAAHEAVVRRCMDAGVHVLVEKPITERPEPGWELAAAARDRGIVLQVGHVERFNPAVRTLAALVGDLEVIAVDAQRLGPPVDRTAIDGVTLDLMIHDVDVVQSVLDAEPKAIGACGTADGRHATATVEYDDVVATFTASRVTQRKIRRLSVTARECLIEVDYLDQSVMIYRDSLPVSVEDGSTNRIRHESVIERPEVKNREPLRVEIESFIQAARTGSEPAVTAADGLRALETVQEIDRRIDAGGVEVQNR